MTTIAVKRIRTNVRYPRKQIADTNRLQTFQEWLSEEANVGKIILAADSANTQLPPKPQGSIDFWSVHNEARTDRF